MSHIRSLIPPLPPQERRGPAPRHVVTLTCCVLPLPRAHRGGGIIFYPRPPLLFLESAESSSDKQKTSKSTQYICRVAPVLRWGREAELKGSVDSDWRERRQEGGASVLAEKKKKKNSCSEPNVNAACLSHDYKHAEGDYALKSPP